MSRKWRMAILFKPLLLIAVLGAFLLAGPSFGAEDEKDRKELPERAVSVAPEYTGVSIERDTELSLDLVVTNGGRKDEDINLKVTTVPEGWRAWVKTYSYGVSGVHVKSDKTKNLTLRLEPGDQVGPGEYVFTVEAKTPDGQLTSTSQVTVTVTEKEKETKAKGLNLVTSYPVLRGPTDGKFEFSVEVDNKTEKEAVYNLVAQGPENWEVNFKPAYEDKFISSLRLKENQSQSVAVEVKPYPLAKPGEYPITVRISSADAKAEASLTVVLTGTHKLDAGTANGLLSLNAVRGEEANLSFYVKNSGSATLNNVGFLSLKPENWKVEFKPEKFDVLGPQELKQVEVTITPANQALVGDYSVGLTTESGRVSKSLELRVAVRASTAWGWIGIGVILLVVLGLVVLFIRLGRR